MDCHISGSSDCFPLLDNLLALFLRGWELVWPAYGFMAHFKASGMRQEAFMCYGHYNINYILLSPIKSSKQPSNKQTNGKMHSSEHQVRMLGEDRGSMPGILTFQPHFPTAWLMRVAPLCHRASGPCPRDSDQLSVGVWGFRFAEKVRKGRNNQRIIWNVSQPDLGYEWQELDWCLVNKQSRDKSHLLSPQGYQGVESRPSGWCQRPKVFS